MSEAHAKAAVEEEMERRSQPSRWDAPVSRRLRPMRIGRGVEWEGWWGLGRDGGEDGI